MDIPRQIIRKKSFVIEQVEYADGTFKLTTTNMGFSLAKLEGIIKEGLLLVQDKLAMLTPSRLDITPAKSDDEDEQPV